MLTIIFGNFLIFGNLKISCFYRNFRLLLNFKISDIFGRLLCNFTLNHSKTKPSNFSHFYRDFRSFLNLNFSVILGRLQWNLISNRWNHADRRFLGGWVILIQINIKIWCFWDWAKVILIQINIKIGSSLNFNFSVILGCFHCNLVLNPIISWPSKIGKFQLPFFFWNFSFWVCVYVNSYDEWL